MELHIIINQKAGSGRAKEAANTILEQLSHKQITAFTYITEYHRHAVSLATSLLETVLVPWTENVPLTDFPLLVVLGGDGTLHEVVNALSNHPNIPVAYLPCGSGNDFARGVHLSREPLKALEHILKSTKPQHFNVLHYEDDIQKEQGLFTNNIGIGVDAAIVSKTNKSKSKKLLNKYNLGSMTYLLAASSVIFKQKGFPVTIEANGEQLTYSNTFLCTTTNHPYFGGGVALAPDADPKEEVMDLILVERIPMIKLLGLIGKLLKKTHMSSPYVHHLRSTHIRIISTTSQYGQTDGEEMGHRPFDIHFTIRKRLFWL